MPTTPETIAADIAEATTVGFRGRLIARGQARAIIWRDGALPPDDDDAVFIFIIIIIIIICYESNRY